MDDERRAWLNGGVTSSSIPRNQSVRETRNAQQRARRARQSSNSMHAEDVRERRNVQQRERRARQNAAAVGADDLDGEAGAISIRERQNMQRREKRQQNAASCRAQDSEIREELSSRVLSACRLSEEDIQWLAKGQRFLQDPRLALAYYHFCGTDPDSFVFGDEQLGDALDSSARSRIANMLGDCPGPSDIARCQRSVQDLASESTSIWACASCGRVLLENAAERVYFNSLDELRVLVKLADDELEGIYGCTSEEMARRYRQLLYVGNEVFF